MKNLHDFVASIVENGGATFNLVTGTSPTTGFVVSERGFEDITPIFGDDVTKEILVSSSVYMFIRKNGFELNDPKNFLGGWIDDGRLFLDISRVYDNEHDALRIAVDNGQEAYYHIDNDKTTEI
jgi:hypothetical protein